mmetsp:Transcript_19205/g.32346  ORF Transcript_19205/g.32346 Transcript_19205/m.32346 type:complete len:96 (-) Transcript_19205:35-322(-)
METAIVFCVHCDLFGKGQGCQRISKGTIYEYLSSVNEVCRVRHIVVCSQAGAWNSLNFLVFWDGRRKQHEMPEDSVYILAAGGQAEKCLSKGTMM